ncbi:RNA-dependent RNA polymerase family protein [Thiorhodovibrio frisius]|uniref:hypothetical protein n=1 Tax=Thiorhodovibrio frisius TaxID=631362 RepID=UPI002B261FE9|nr:hypothetical protein [Thiorhodovibrio frisius]
MKQTSLLGIAKKAASAKAHRFRNLFALLNVSYLLACWRLINKGAASGVERLDARAYEANLQDNVDFVCAFECEFDAQRFYRVLGLRMERFGLEVTQEKTQLLRFSSQDWTRNGTFEFLGFEFRWGRGRWRTPALKRRTARKKYRASLASFRDWCRAHCRMHKDKFFAALNAKLRGYYNYYVKNSGLFIDNKLISSIATASFGIYLVHPVFLDLFKKPIVDFVGDLSVATLILLSITFSLSFAIILFLRKISFIKKIC